MILYLTDSFFLTDVCYNNIKYAMIGHLQNPPAEFSEIIKAHYYMKKDKLIKVGTCMNLKIFWVYSGK